MHIGVNLLFMVPGEVGGSEPLLTNLVRAMTESNNQFTIFGVKGFPTAYPEIAGRAHIVEVPWSTGAQPLRITAENSWLGIQLRRLKLDLVHHGVGTTPFVKVLPSVVTIHDVHYRHYPENFVKLKRWWLRINVPFSARNCEVVSVPSQWVKNDIVSSFRTDPNRVAVVPFGSERLFGDSPISVDEARSKYRLEGPYFFFPGRAYPHKNHRFLLEAFSVLDAEADLVFTGPAWFRDKEVFGAIRHMRFKGRVRHLGQVERRDLAGLYAGAAALVYPSRFEGFGAPVLEAMSVGCPVISSNVAALPEVVGEAGILLDPLDQPAWTETMAKILADTSIREGLIKKGYERAAQFSWDRSARLQLEAYEQALNA